MRYCWQILDIEFCATGSPGSGWDITAMIGTCEIMEETYHPGPVAKAIEWSTQWTTAYSQELREAALNFNISDIL